MKATTAIMAAPTLPIPDADKWLTRRRVAQLCKVGPVTVWRWADTGVLTPHYPESAPGEKPPPLFWRTEVEDLIAARKRLGVQD